MGLGHSKYWVPRSLLIHGKQLNYRNWSYNRNWIRTVITIVPLVKHSPHLSECFTKSLTLVLMMFSELNFCTYYRFVEQMRSITIFVTICSLDQCTVLKTAIHWTCTFFVQSYTITWALRRRCGTNDDRATTHLHLCVLFALSGCCEVHARPLQDVVFQPTSPSHRPLQDCFCNARYRTSQSGLRSVFTMVKRSYNIITSVFDDLHADLMLCRNVATPLVNPLSCIIIVVYCSFQLCVMEVVM